MGEDRRQGDRRQNTEDRRGEASQFQDRRGTGMPTKERKKKESFTISLKTFIISIAIVLILIIGIVWFAISTMRNEIDDIYANSDYEVYDELDDEDYLYDEDFMLDESYDECELNTTETNQ